MVLVEVFEVETGGQRITKEAQRELKIAAVQAVANVAWNLAEQWPRLTLSASGQGGVETTLPETIATSTTTATPHGPDKLYTLHD